MLANNFGDECPESRCLRDLNYNGRRSSMPFFVIVSNIGKCSKMTWNWDSHHSKELEVLQNVEGSMCMMWCESRAHSTDAYLKDVSSHKVGQSSADMRLSDIHHLDIHHLRHSSPPYWILTFITSDFHHPLPKIRHSSPRRSSPQTFITHNCRIRRSSPKTFIT